MKIVTYIRVSTEQQGQSGLGMEGQQAAIDTYSAASGAHVVGAFIEVESGRNNTRPQLHAAMKLARVTGSRLVIAKLDRLGRNAAFLLNLQASGVDFVCCDDPNTTPLTIGVKAIIAEEEARQISARTKAALAAAKARGTRLGNPNGAAALRRAGKGNAAACQAQRNAAMTRAQDLSEVLDDIESGGHVTLAAIAGEMNRRGIKTARGGRWHPNSVARLRKRLEAA
ncbi:recombinase family protein [Salipiger mucosus]|uniref:recombinase family protein n=1 Tax=Salipiger mucosus TaxID=263378 RepID=UPI000364F1DC|nr:recombinase family protein [Salipiger mucosus]